MRLVTFKTVAAHLHDCMCSLPLAPPLPLAPAPAASQQSESVQAGRGQLVHRCVASFFGVSWSNGTGGAFQIKHTKSHGDIP